MDFSARETNETSIDYFRSGDCLCEIIGGRMGCTERKRKWSDFGTRGQASHGPTNRRPFTRNSDVLFLTDSRPTGMIINFLY